MEHFYAYRIFLNQNKKEQLELNFKNKKETFVEVLNEIQRKTIAFQDYGEHYMIFNQKKGENIYILQLAKKHQFAKHILEKGKIEDILDEHFPNIYLIIHIEKQLILIQKNTVVFQTLDGVKSKIAKFFTEQMIENGVHCALSEITDHRGFWEQIKEFDSIQKVDFEYSPPNFFGGKNAADKLVKDVYEETNFEKFKITLQNKLNGLKFRPKDFKEHILRLSQGAGDYVITGVKNGVIQTITKLKKLHVKEDISSVNNESTESLEERFNQIEDINNDENF